MKFHVLNVPIGPIASRLNMWNLRLQLLPDHWSGKRMETVAPNGPMSKPFTAPQIQRGNRNKCQKILTLKRTCQKCGLGVIYSEQKASNHSGTHYQQLSFPGSRTKITKWEIDKPPTNPALAMFSRKLIFQTPWAPWVRGSMWSSSAKSLRPAETPRLAE